MVLALLTLFGRTSCKVVSSLDGRDGVGDELPNDNRLPSSVSSLSSPSLKLVVPTASHEYHTRLIIKG